MTVDSPQQVTPLKRYTSQTFLVLVASSLFLLIGVTLVSLWRAPTLIPQILHLCRAGWGELSGHLPAATAFIVPAALVVGGVRGTAKLAIQLWRTRRYTRSLAALLQPMPRRLERLAQELRIGQRVVCVASDRPFAFCEGYWKPRIWVSSGLLAHLDDEELVAVLRHETHHVRQRDPLRLLVVRTLREALFFLPAVRSLSSCYEVEQEVSADRAAGEVLPLASALHKLLVSGADQTQHSSVALSGLNVTEARIRQLIRPESSRRATGCRPTVALSLAVVLIVLGMALAPAGQFSSHLDLGYSACGTGSWASIPATFIR